MIERIIAHPAGGGDLGSGEWHATIAEAREYIVRCRDCAEWYEYDAYERTWPEITEFKLHECRRFKTRDPDGFCAWGDRRGA